MVYSDGNEETMSHNESLVRAMIENAKSSSPRENLENAAMAQKNFMLVQFDKSVSDGNKDKEFLQQLAKRSKEIRNNKDRSNWMSSIIHQFSIHRVFTEIHSAV